MCVSRRSNDKHTKSSKKTAFILVALLHLILEQNVQVRSFFEKTPTWEDVRLAGQRCLPPGILTAAAWRRSKRFFSGCRLYSVPPAPLIPGVSSARPPRFMSVTARGLTRSRRWRSHFLLSLAFRVKARISREWFKGFRFQKIVKNGQKKKKKKVPYFSFVFLRLVLLLLVNIIYIFPPP